MKILFAAPITFDKITFFISTYIVGLAHAAKDLGHEVKVIQTTDTKLPDILNCFRKEYRIFRRYFGFITQFPNDLYLEQQISEEAEKFKPEILFLHLINTYNLSHLIKNLRSKGIKVVTWLGVHPANVHSGIHKIIKNSDYTLIYDGTYIEYYKKKLNINNIQILPLGCNVSYYDTINPDDNFIKKNGVNICFAGFFDKWRERFLEEISDLGLGIWSWNLGDFKTNLVSNYKGVVYGETLIKVLKSSKIAINIHQKSEVGGGNYRLFEIPASKTFQIVDEKKNIGEYFKIGEEIITFKNKKELRNKVQYYLKNEKERDEIALASYKRIKKDHDLKNRVEQLIEIIKTDN